MGFAKKLSFIVVGLALVFIGLHFSGLDVRGLFHGSLQERVRSLQQGVEAQGAWKYPVFFFFFSVLPLLLVPTSLLCLVAGIAFNGWEAGLLIWSGSLGCTALSFFFARFLAREWVERVFLQRIKFLKELDERAGEHGFKISLISRFLPFPFVFAGYAAGLSKMGFGALAAGTAVAMLPWALFYALFSHSVTEGSAPATVFGLVVFGVVLLVSWKAKAWAGMKVNRGENLDSGRN